MNAVTKILLINAGVTFFIALLFAFSNGMQTGGFVLSLGLTCLAIGLLDLLISLILFISGESNRESAQGFLLSAGVLLVVGFAVCGGGLAIG